MNYIIGIHGKKQSGKDTLADGIIGIIREINEGKTIKETMKDVSEQSSYSYDNRIYHLHKINFADPLKEMCITLFGATNDQMYGSNNYKNTELNIYWSDLFQLVGDKTDNDEISSPGSFIISMILFLIRNKIIYDKPYIENIECFSYNGKQPTRMSNGQILSKNPFDWKVTAREFLQFFGTDIIRRLNDSAWINAWEKHVCSLCKYYGGTNHVVITPDVRFANELLSIRETGKKINSATTILIKLKRSCGTYNDAHSSEKGIEDAMFDKCIPDIGIKETLNECVDFLKTKGLNI